MIVIGKTKEIYHDNTLPSITELVSDTPTQNKSDVLKYLRKGKITSCSPACIRDIFTNEIINIPLNCMTDGIYAWRSDAIYYFEKYNLKLDDTFIDYVLKMEERIHCPLLNEPITPVECMENRDIDEKYIPDKFKSLQDWKEICQNCKYHDY